jgi:gliding motility-associated-like protein
MRGESYEGGKLCISMKSCIFVPFKRFSVKKGVKYRAWLLAVLAFLPVRESGGQITAPQADAAADLSYPAYTGQGQLFVFYQKHGGYRPGALTAVGPATGSFDFIWTQYDPEDADFTIPVKAESGVTQSVIDLLDDGGYRVQISNGADVDTAFIAWVMLDDLKVRINQTAEGKIPKIQSSCADENSLTLIGAVEADSFFYYDPVSHEQLSYENDFNIEWSSDDPQLFIPNSTNKDAMAFNTTYLPPVLDTWFILTATDSLGMTETDSALFDSPFTRAAFSVEYYDKKSGTWDPDLKSEWSKDNGSLDAPLTVRLINESLNGVKFTWVLLDSSGNAADIVKEGPVDSLYVPEFTYETADKFYYPYLISESADGPCPDTFRLETGIEVVASQLLIPNVFTPNGDEINDVFIFKHQSLKSCRVTISDRSGRVVYRQKIDDIYEWEGWRGTILNSERPAPEGQYYYVIEGLGYDNKEYRDPNYLEQRKLNKEPGGSTDPANGEENASLNLYTGWLYLFRQKGVY